MRVRLLHYLHSTRNSVPSLNCYAAQFYKPWFCFAPYASWKLFRVGWAGVYWKFVWFTHVLNACLPIWVAWSCGLVPGQISIKGSSRNTRLPSLRQTKWNGQHIHLNCGNCTPFPTWWLFPGFCAMLFVTIMLLLLTLYASMCWVERFFSSAICLQEGDRWDNQEFSWNLS